MSRRGLLVYWIENSVLRKSAPFPGGRLFWVPWLCEQWNSFQQSSNGLARQGARV
jgi:hypothetical protein